MLEVVVFLCVALARGRGPSQGQERQEGEEKEAACDMVELAARTRGHSQVAVAAPPDVIKPPMWCECTSSMENSTALLHPCLP